MSTPEIVIKEDEFSDIEKAIQIINELSEKIYFDNSIINNPKVKRLLSSCYTIGKFKTSNKKSNNNFKFKEYMVANTNVCYFCKVTFENSHYHYNSMCVGCGNLNFKKRDVRIDLSGKTGIVTGARIKIGYYTALQLLRCNVRVIVTTRFANDALRRYQKEGDYDEWKDNLDIVQVNFRCFDQVTSFVNYVKANYTSLDYLINNAAQTIRRPYEFYEHIIDAKQVEDTNKNIKKLFGDFVKDFKKEEAQIDKAYYVEMQNLQELTNLEEAEDKSTKMVLHNNKNFQLTTDKKEEYFPKDKVDEHDQQIDMRDSNSWMLDIDEVNPVESFEVHMINSIVPGYLNGKFKPLLKNKECKFRSWIINVSSMEGCFSKPNKTTNHPHTNMAKASMNMMTRTCGRDFIKDNIVMVSVDTGWNTIEQVKSYEIKSPIDCVDGAARILDPIFRGLKTHSVFYKDFKQTHW